ncbi:hypothetical protein [Pseudomonas sp. Root562]|uniref:hypothetical protein n=1 Tax=Pseudomonas sp. Root562 TaxID=1736561 RepID=UPI001F1D92CF|nr:hypothetical protein [Pseudomonas sp. Root562]
MGGSILLIAGIYLFQYIQVEKIPLSITSSAVVAALPAMFAMLVFVIAMLGALIVMPAFIIFHRLNDSGERLSDHLSFDQGKSGLTPLRRRLMLHWLYGVLLLGGFVWLVGVHASYGHTSGWWMLGMVALGGLTLLGHAWIITRVWKTSVSLEFWFACVMSALVQWIAILNVTVVVARSVSEYVDDVWLFIPFMFLELVLLWLIQLGGAYFVVVMRRHEHPVAHAALVAMVVIFVLGLIPQTSAKLAGVTLQLPSSGARNCTVMTWAASTQLLEAINDPDNPGSSIRLRLLAEADGMYIVRPWRAEAKAVQFVPRSSVTGIDECAPEPKTDDATR